MYSLKVGAKGKPNEANQKRNPTESKFCLAQGLLLELLGIRFFLSSGTPRQGGCGPGENLMKGTCAGEGSMEVSSTRKGEKSSREPGLRSWIHWFLTQASPVNCAVTRVN